MHDPINAFNTIRDNFLLYIKTAFATQFPEIEQEREKRLLEPGVFYQEPWIEPLAAISVLEKLSTSLNYQMFQA